VDKIDVKKAHGIPFRKPVAAVLPIETILLTIYKPLSATWRDNPGDIGNGICGNMQVVTVKIEMQHIVDAKLEKY
jgi:hypothetical protein